MSLFDRVWIRCPFCDNELEFQSHSGDCKLDDYTLYDAPQEVLADLIGEEIICDNCGKESKLVVVQKLILDIGKVE
jgi:hypothetical protein